MASPNSYKDPYWSQLAMNTEQSLGLPDGLLVSVLTKGERSNADQVSEAGAKTPFQIIPSTRKAAIDKYGIDPYLNDKNAAKVAGLLLKDSLDRNKGDASLAVAEYHGGTDRSQWGPRTKSYVQRVTGGMQPANAGGDVVARAYDAYRGGRMTPEDAAEFEADVSSGLVQLPLGASLKRQATAPEPQYVVPQSVVDAYNSGRMSPQDAAEFERDVAENPALLPKGATLNAPKTKGVVESASNFLSDVRANIVGAGEAGLNVITGATGGAIGLAGGAAKGIVESISDGTFGTKQGVRNAEKAAAEGAESLTYQPRTDAGKRQARAVGEAMQQILPIAPMTGELAAVGRASAPVTQAIKDQAKGFRAVDVPVPQGSSQPANVTPINAQPKQKTPGTMASVGSAGTDIAMQRRKMAQDLPVPIELTKGQAERSFEQQRFEQETAKNPDIGLPLRERQAQQNQDLPKNFDAWFDQTGAQAPDVISAGRAVDKALFESAKRDKTEINVAYKNAEKAGEMAEPVSMGGIADYLNESTSAESVAPVLSAAKKELIRLGGAELDDAGNLRPKDMSLNDAEYLRKFINRVAGNDSTNQLYAKEIKNVIDASTEGLGGDLYKKARALRVKYADKYESRAIVSDLLNKKRGTADRKVALEDVFDRTIIKGSQDDIKFLRRILQTSGDEGKQAWKELQGQTVNYLKNEGMKNNATDIRGNTIFSSAGLNKAVKSLDHDGKLDFVFGKKGAQQIRDINDLAKVIYTAPPGSVNTSNTASVILAALTEAGAAGALTGLPLPVLSALRAATKHLKDRKLAKRVNDALNAHEAAKNKPVQTQGNKTIH